MEATYELSTLPLEQEFHDAIRVKPVGKIVLSMILNPAQLLVGRSYWFYSVISNVATFSLNLSQEEMLASLETFLNHGAHFSGEYGVIG